MMLNKWRVVQLLEQGVKRRDILRLMLGKDLGVQKGLFERGGLDNICERYGREGVEVIVYGDKKYPELLKAVVDPPVALFCRGDVSLLQKRCVAVVGSRDQSERGRRAVRRLVPELVNPSDSEGGGFVVVSGLALGTDAQVHRVVLGSRGETIVVLPVGLDRIYPAQHQTLAKEILRWGGLLLSEYPFATGVRKHRFLERNRIVAGLSEAVLIVEAGKPSGAVSTANFAADAGREVWVVGVKKGEKNSEGILNLIEDGAKIV